jgi:trans-aconitate methyltransferase
MKAITQWSVEYFEEKFTNPDPWKYLTSYYERAKYQRQLDVIADRVANPQNILEIGPAEGAHTFLLAQLFPGAKITAIEISSRALKRAHDNLLQFEDRIELVNADIAEYKTKLKENCYDVSVWSESIYYLGARLPLTEICDLVEKVGNSLKLGGLLVMANTVNLPASIPESAVTKRPLLDSYYSILSSLVLPLSRSVYFEEKLGTTYEYQIWAFLRQK